LAGGCENAVTITGNVIVPAEVQQLFSPEQPGTIEIRASKAGGNGGARYLCLASGQALVLPYSIVTFGCVDEQLVEARAFHVNPALRDNVRCGEPAGGSPSGGLIGEDVAYGAAIVFAGRHAGGCDSGSDTADVTMAVKAMR